MSPEQETTKAFIEAQLLAVQPQIQQAKIMQRSWAAGGETFKANLDAVSKSLGAWLAVEEDLKAQLAELETPEPPTE